MMNLLYLKAKHKFGNIYESFYVACWNSEKEIYLLVQKKKCISVYNNRKILNKQYVIRWELKFYSQMLIIMCTGMPSRNI
jgi:hypothetical protein